jgi:hypothetical protein
MMNPIASKRTLNKRTSRNRKAAPGVEEQTEGHVAAGLSGAQKSFQAR